MNPEYQGRTELPENIKALFRPCAMIVPDLQNIAEIMLSAEGFKQSKDLAKKFVTLYTLNRELLSKQVCPLVVVERLPCWNPSPLLATSGQRTEWRGPTVPTTTWFSRGPYWAWSVPMPVPVCSFGLLVPVATKTVQKKRGRRRRKSPPSPRFDQSTLSQHDHHEWRYFEKCGLTPPPSPPLL